MILGEYLVLHERPENSLGSSNCRVLALFGTDLRNRIRVTRYPDSDTTYL